jgi:Do/DeqQ family serine protease
MTNSHLIQDADRIVVTLKDKRAYDASLIGMDTGTDIALLRIHANHLTELHLGDSDKLRVGDYIVAIGNPFGLGQTVSTGIVGALGLTQLGIEEYEDFIQTDASLNPGDSGGALVDMQGELIGINTAIYSVGGGNAGIGFAIPANLARASMDRLLKYGEVHRGWLGLRIEDLTPSIAPVMGVSVVEGAIVNEVFPDSPARKAGIRPGDVIISINGRSVRNAGHFRNEVGTMALGEIARVTVIRDEAKLGYSMRVEEQASTEPEPSGVEGTGLLAGARFKAGPDSASGVAIVDIEDGCALARAGLEAEDVIMSVNRRAVSGVDSLFEAFAAPGPFALRIRRDRSELFVVLR